MSTRSCTRRSELQSSGVTLVDCPHNGQKDVADFMLMIDMLTYAIDTPGPSTIVLITGDRDFAYVAAVLRQRKYKVVLMSPKRVHASLTAQVSVCLDWRTVLGRDGESTRSSSPLEVVSVIPMAEAQQEPVSISLPCSLGSPGQVQSAENCLQVTFEQHGDLAAMCEQDDLSKVNVPSVIDVKPPPALQQESVPTLDLVKDSRPLTPATAEIAVQCPSSPPPLPKIKGNRSRKTTISSPSRKMSFPLPLRSPTIGRLAQPILTVATPHNNEGLHSLLHDWQPATPSPVSTGMVTPPTSPKPDMRLTPLLNPAASQVELRGADVVSIKTIMKGAVLSSSPTAVTDTNTLEAAAPILPALSPSHQRVAAGGPANIPTSVTTQAAIFPVLPDSAAVPPSTSLRKGKANQRDSASSNSHDGMPLSPTGPSASSGAMKEKRKPWKEVKATKQAAPVPSTSSSSTSLGQTDVQCAKTPFAARSEKGEVVARASTTPLAPPPETVSITRPALPKSHTVVPIVAAPLTIPALPLLPGDVVPGMPSHFVPLAKFLEARRRAGGALYTRTQIMNNLFSKQKGVKFLYLAAGATGANGYYTKATEAGIISVSQGGKKGERKVSLEPKWFGKVPV